MNTTLRGKAAETAVAEKFKHSGYKLISMNWRTRFCEIDIIAKKDKIIYFVEVKSRSSRDQGSGVDYITPKKIKQLKFAAELWCSEQKWDGDYRLVAVGVSVSSGSIKISKPLEIN